MSYLLCIGGAQHVWRPSGYRYKVWTSTNTKETATTSAGATEYVRQVCAHCYAVRDIPDPGTD